MKNKRASRSPAGLHDYGFAVLSGVLAALAFPKFRLFFLAWICLIPLIGTILTKKPGRAFRLGLAAGFIFYAVLLYWLPAVPAHYGNLSWGFSFFIYLVLALYLSLFWGGFCYVTARISRRYPIGVYLLIPFIWTSFEYLITHILTGFPWGVLGYSQQPNLAFIQSAAVFGVYGISFILLLFQSLFLCSMRLRKRSPFLAAVAFVLFVHSAGLLVLQHPVERAGALRAGIVQGNVSSEVYWHGITDADKWELFERHLELSEECRQNGAEIIIWPEFSVSLCFSCNYGLYKDFRRILEDYAETNNISFLLGTNEISEQPDRFLYYNTALALSPSGDMTRYSKMHLVPFGEYTPYKWVFGFIERLTHAIGELTPGDGYVLHSVKGVDFGTPICYEIIFPDLVRGFVARGARFLVTITDDGWFGTSAAPYQHFAMAVFRAVENRRPLLRAATTGISGVVDPYGRIRENTPLNVRASLTAEIGLIQEKTLYTRWGDILPYLSLTLAGVFLILALFKRKDKKDLPPKSAGKTER